MLFIPQGSNLDAGIHRTSPLYNYNYHVYAEDFQIYTSSSDLSPKLQILVDILLLSLTWALVKNITIYNHSFSESFLSLFITIPAIMHIQMVNKFCY